MSDLTLHPSLMPDEWYHGSSSSEPFEKFDHDRDKPDQYTPKHWNSHLGSHWTSVHSVAGNISADHGGNTYHASLGFQSPRHYDSEFELDHDAHLWANRNGFNVPNRRGVGSDRDRSETLTEHPQVKEIAHGFRDHLESMGFDGITYGNEYEGPKRHTCAIAFDPDHITIKHAHRAFDSCDQAAGHCEDCGHEINTPQCSNCGHFTMLGSKTASEESFLPNPYHENDDAHHTWFHGSPVDIGDEPLHSPHHYSPSDFPNKNTWESGPQMNTLLGTHFSALRDVAKGFIPHNISGHVYHARLSMKNPAYFPDEHELDRAIFRHAVKHHPDFTGNEKFNDTMRWSYSTTPRNLAERDRQIEADPEAGRHVRSSAASTMGTMLRMHPAQPEIAKSFVQHLRDKGHDGIVYGNNVEGPRYHHCAIALHPDDIHIDEVTSAHKAHPYDESGDRVRDIQRAHIGYEDRYAPDAWKNEGNLDHGPWKPYRESTDWTPYAKESVRRTAAEMPPFRRDVLGEHLLAHHPGLEYAMSWDNPEDHKPLTKTVGSQDVDSWMLGEVPIRPGAPVHIKALHVTKPDGSFHRIPINQHHTAVRKPVRRDRLTGLELCRKKVDGFPCKFILGHAQDCDVDWNAVYPDEDEGTTKEASGIPQMSDEAKALLAEHLAHHHPDIEPGGAFADYHHRLTHLDNGERTMGPCTGQEPMFGGMGHDHDPRIDPYKSHWHREAQRLAVQSDGTQWWHGTSPDMATRVKSVGRFPDDYLDDDPAKVGKRQPVWGRGVYMTEGPHETSRFGGEKIPVKHTMKNPFVLKPEMGFPGPLTPPEHLPKASKEVFDREYKVPWDPDYVGKGNEAGPALRKALLHAGHDGIVFPGDDEHTRWAVAYNPGDVHYDHEVAKHTAMGANGPDYDNLHFQTEDDIEPHRESGSMKIRAIHPEHGDVGYLSFIPRNRDRTADMNDDWTHVEVNNLHVDHEHQRRGVASQLMDHLHHITGEDVDIDHGGRTYEGGQWAHGYFGDDEHPSGRKVQDDWVHTAGANGPDYEDLTYSVAPDGAEPNLFLMRAHHPEHGIVGDVHFDVQHHEPPLRPTVVNVRNLEVSPEHQRRGVASALMDRLEEMHPDAAINHGVRSQQGHQWASAFYGTDVPADRQARDYDEHWTRKRKPIPASEGLHPYKYEAAVRNVGDAASDGDGITEGIMIAIVPPEDTAARLHIEEGESPEQLHVTLAYLGQTPEYDAEHLAELKETVADWARENSPLTATVQGVGTFVKGQEDGQHVLWAAVDAPGLERMHVTLVDHLRAYGYSPRENHVFTPHMTLAYGKHHFRFVPKIERESWTVDEVWVCIAGRWESVTLGEREVRHDRTAGRGKPRRDSGAGDPVPDGGGGGAGPVGDGAPAPRPVTFHPKAEKDLGKMHKNDQRMIRDTVDRLASGDPSLQTHPLTGKLTGWYSTKASRGHRVIHQPDGQGGIHVGYVGLHEYGDAINRLAAFEKIFAL